MHDSEGRPLRVVAGHGGSRGDGSYTYTGQRLVALEEDDGSADSDTSYDESAAYYIPWCPQCLSEIPIGAKRCAFCTSEVPA